MPAASRPSINILISLLPKILLSMFPIFGVEPRACSLGCAWSVDLSGYALGGCRLVLTKQPQP